MAKFLTITVGAGVTILVNEIPFMSDKDGRILVNLDEVVIERKGLSEFDKMITSMITEVQKEELYDLFTSSSRVGVNELANILGIDRVVAKNILILGIKHGVMRKQDTQWRLHDHNIRNILKELRLIKQQTAKIADDVDFKIIEEEKVPMLLEEEEEPAFLSSVREKDEVIVRNGLPKKIKKKVKQKGK